MIKVEHLYKYFQLSTTQQKKLGLTDRNLTALSDLSFSVEAGKVLLVLGPQYAGKSTLLQILGAVLKADKGSVSVAGFDANTQGADVRRKVGYLNAHPVFFEYLTVAEQLEYAASLNATKLTATQLSDYLEQYELGAVAKKRLSAISEQERLRLSIAQALVHQPQVLLLDEPALGMDLFTAQPILDAVQDAKMKGMTVVLATNNIGKAELVGDEILFLQKGKALKQASVEDFRSHAEDGSLVSAFLNVLGG